MQLEGNIKFGVDPDTLIDYSDEISSLMINYSRNPVTVPATFGNAKERERAGSGKDQVTINFFHDESDAAGFWAECWDAAHSESGELYFTATFKPGPVAPDNPQFEGWVTVLDLDTGGTVGEWKQQSKTWPARDVARVDSESS